MQSDQSEQGAKIKLGESNAYTDAYSPTLLHPIPRSHSRAALIADGDMPFNGCDVWTAYELSWLDAKGKPQVAIGQFTFAADTDAIIESKSFKYYLNSFNQTRFTSANDVRETMGQDLSAACGGNVGISFFAIDEYIPASSALPGICIDEESITGVVYQPDARILAVDGSAPVVTESIYSHLLKSNCPVTGQPDWATLWVEYRGHPVDRASLLTYIVSYRQHQDFHENCVEKIFCDLMQVGDFESLAVYARYTRRGGLDINPYRVSYDRAMLLPQYLENVRTGRQ
ncbi:NADPH-dependent 7-cyano-7-deazaguanine reductase QueF [Teredinibacter waterburyi]|jgi:7-cyano-7-deazaguanine reductase|uniref:NADPH-dependent 7-cyano-7-deazaguanine reductase QueF n=1 Tax=Teredinibacter waterburyi TaxID=1500538 RepID=UPI00165EEA81|nr:NADPH-dependent 7-cyano-7-deazaguanine reductase QueF [Teredinibacter waterburyi]